MGDRGKWNTARVVTIMLAAFHVSTWGLELSLDLALRTDGPVDLLNRPPPVVSSGDPDAVGMAFDWIVQRNIEAVDETGTLDNFKGNLEVGYATTVYRIGDDFVRGTKVFTSWSTVPGDAPAAVFYDENGEGDYALVAGLQCSTSSTSHPVYLSDGQQMEEWGTATECESGPRLANMSTEESPPVIILNGTIGSGFSGSSGSSEGRANHDENVHLIVEEDSSYPSFMYSVWRPVTPDPANNVSQPAELHHQFYVSSTTRLAEAIVTGVANGIMSGGGCVDLLSQFSVDNTAYELGVGMSRVAPFGEYPSSSSVESMDEVEEIVAGINVSELGMVCGLILTIVTAASFAGCLASFSGRPMDVFDRDAVIRAVALPNGEREVDITSPALKIYVRQSDDRRFGMVISDADATSRRRIAKCLRGCTGARDGSSPESDSSGSDGSNEDAPAPARGLSRTWSLPRVSLTRVSGDHARPNLGILDEALEGSERENVGRQPVAPQPARTPQFVELVASPIPSLARGSLVRGGSQSVLRGLPTFFSSEMMDTKTADTISTNRHISPDHGLSSVGTSSKSQKRLAGPALVAECVDGGSGSPDGGDSPVSRDATASGAQATSSSGEDTKASDPNCVAEIEDDAASGRPVAAERASSPREDPP